MLGHRPSIKGRGGCQIFPALILHRMLLLRVAVMYHRQGILGTGGTLIASPLLQPQKAVNISQRCLA